VFEHVDLNVLLFFLLPHLSDASMQICQLAVPCLS